MIKNITTLIFSVIFFIITGKLIIDKLLVISNIKEFEYLVLSISAGISISFFVYLLFFYEETDKIKEDL